MALLTFLAFAAPRLPPTEAFVYAGNDTFPSLPALFGRALPGFGAHAARLQYLPEAPYLCEPLHNLSFTSFVVPPPADGDRDAATSPASPSFYEPVVLLAARGACPFVRKAAVAEALHPSVQYLLVYNNFPRPQQQSPPSWADPNDEDDADALVPMFAEFGDSRLVLLSLSARSGAALKRWLAVQPRPARRSGGPRVWLDALPPTARPATVNGGNVTATVDLGPLLASLGDLGQLLLAALGLLLAFLCTGGCLLWATGAVAVGQVHVAPDRIVVTTRIRSGGGDSSAEHLDLDGATSLSGDGTGPMA